MKLYFLHGFAGEPQDWDEVIAHLPGHTCLALSYPFELPSDGTFVGYSMGGRIALKSPRPKIIISAHPGVQTREEKVQRTAKVDAWIHKLKTETLSAFFEEWYAQPLLETLRAHPNFQAILERRLKQDPQILIKQLEVHRLEELPIRNAIFLHGDLDQTYSDLYKKLKIPSHAVSHAGHACHLENPVDTARQIKILIDSFS